MHSQLDGESGKRYRARTERLRAEMHALNAEMAERRGQSQRVLDTVVERLLQATRTAESPSHTQPAVVARSKPATVVVTMPLNDAQRHQHNASA